MLLANRFYYSNGFLCNALTEMYGKNSNATIAQRLFRRTLKDIVTWNTMISSYTHNGLSAKADALIDQMISEKLKPNSYFISAVSACSQLAPVKKGQRVHQCIKEAGSFYIFCDVFSSLYDNHNSCPGEEMEM